jgi:hypothetical protein
LNDALVREIDAAMVNGKLRESLVAHRRNPVA